MRKSNRVRVHHEKKSNRARVDHEKKSDGVRVHHEKKSDRVNLTVMAEGCAFESSDSAAYY